MGCSCLGISFMNAMTSDPSVFLLPAWQHKCAFQACQLSCMPTSHPRACRNCESSRFGDHRSKVTSLRPPRDSLTQTSWHRSQDVRFLTVSPVKLIKRWKSPLPFITVDKGPAARTELLILLLMPKAGCDPVHSWRATEALPRGCHKKLVCIRDLHRRDFKLHMPGKIVWIYIPSEVKVKVLKNCSWF